MQELGLPNPLHCRAPQKEVHHHLGGTLRASRCLPWLLVRRAQGPRLAVLNVRQAGHCICHTRRRQVRAGYTGTPDAHDLYRAPVVRNCRRCSWPEGEAIGRPHPVVHEVCMRSRTSTCRFRLATACWSRAGTHATTVSCSALWDQADGMSLGCEQRPGAREGDSCRMPNRAGG